LKALSLSKKYKLGLIEIPEEFKDIEIDDDFDAKAKKTKRRLIKNRTDTNLKGYDAWRVHDRQISKQGGKTPCIRVLEFAPALLVKAFGLPGSTRTGFSGSGEYDFEDHNFDVYNLSDYKQTDFYHGLNREDEYYE
jgi:hypothetical protein